MTYLGFSNDNRFAMKDTHWSRRWFRHRFRPCAAAVMIALMAITPGLALAQDSDPGDGSQPPPKLDPQAVEILRDATNFLAQQTAMSVDWLVSFDVVIDGREKITYLRSGQNLLERGVGFYSLTEFGENTRKYFYDGATIQILDVEENAYVMAPFGGSLDQLADRITAEYGARLPIWQIMSTTPNSDLAESADSAAFLGIVKVAGREAYHLAFSNYDRDWQVWVSTDPERPELMMIIGTDPYTQGWPQYRAYFSNWDFDPDIAEGAFTFVPDENAERMAWPKPGDVLSGIGGN